MNIIDKRHSIRKHPTKKPSKRRVTDITDIVIHHSLTKSGSAEAFANYHIGTNGWSVMGYAYVINTDGTIDWCASHDIITPHVGNSNNFSLGICLVGDFRTQKPTEAQYKALIELIRKLQSELPNKCNIKGHSEMKGYSRKQCPVISMDKVRNDVKEDDDTLKLADWQWDMLADNLKAMYDDKVLSSDQWQKKAAAKELTQSELAFLNNIIVTRR